MRPYVWLVVGMLAVAARGVAAQGPGVAVREEGGRVAQDTVPRPQAIRGAGRASRTAAAVVGSATGAYVGWLVGGRNPDTMRTWGAAVLGGTLFSAFMAMLVDSREHEPRLGAFVGTAVGGILPGAVLAIAGAAISDGQTANPRPGLLIGFGLGQGLTTGTLSPR